MPLRMMLTSASRPDLHPFLEASINASIVPGHRCSTCAISDTDREDSAGCSSSGLYQTVPYYRVSLSRSH